MTNVDAKNDFVLVSLPTITGPVMFFSAYTILNHFFQRPEDSKKDLNGYWIKLAMPPMKQFCKKLKSISQYLSLVKEKLSAIKSRDELVCGSFYCILVRFVLDAINMAQLTGVIEDNRILYTLPSKRNKLEQIPS